MPIFKLPGLVRELIVERMSFDDMFIFTLCSKRCFDTVRKIFRFYKDEYQLSVNLGGIEHACGSLLVETPSIRQLITVSSMEKLEWAPFKKEELFPGILGGTPFMGVRENLSTSTFWEDPNTGMKVLLLHITELFNATIGVYIYPSKQFSPLPILNFINERQKTIQFAKVYMSPCDERYEAVLDCLNHVKDLEFPLDMVTCILKYSNRKWQHEKLKFGWAPWIKNSHLMRMNCNSLEIRSCSVQRKDLNAYLKAWIDGAVPRLEHFSLLRVRPHTWNSVFRGILHQENPDRVLMNSLNETRRPVKTPVDIYRNDGTIGTIFCSLVESQLGLRSFRFDFVVWK
ncbi:hypothetical protein CAEBREN_24124 [Caenorhabditis brenneri]|uniref:Sdz-33 F-box domain-containing protein n=1 Tax=Caenorhabditis brenneri TaxID=135651 RepID=G0NMU6_CAEBE|nr:hypothetical protein CAEBREN_24124 [Caenorhabditis brenneri]